jgi:hypothetical protein
MVEQGKTRWLWPEVAISHFEEWLNKKHTDAKRDRKADGVEDVKRSVVDSQAVEVTRAKVLNFTNEVHPKDLPDAPSPDEVAEILGGLAKQKTTSTNTQRKGLAR